MTQAPRQREPWRTLASIPETLETERFVLEPLAPRHAALDFAALMSCRDRLRTELQWGDWPPADFTLDLNRQDLAEHYGEFVRREAFAYTVLSVNREQCLGCVYLERCEEIDGGQLAFWVIDDALEREVELVEEMLHWVHQEWAIERLLLPFHQTNQRGINLARKCGLVDWESPPTGPLVKHVCLLSVAGGLLTSRGLPT
ncbi:MAG: GNAT family N-acetyltransferase [Planctomycetota bacterium]|nr:GNAT family N-acetyltransferase [Planctomycetota bacterium]